MTISLNAYVHKLFELMIPCRCINFTGFCSANCKERDGYPYGSGCNECRPGYLAPDCCDCADNYYRSDDGGCKGENYMFYY